MAVWKHCFWGCAEQEKTTRLMNTDTVNRRLSHVGYEESEQRAQATRDIGEI
jgi:hypothetical protein